MESLHLIFNNISREKYTQKHSPVFSQLKDTTSDMQRHTKGHGIQKPIIMAMMQVYLKQNYSHSANAGEKTSMGKML